MNIEKIELENYRQYRKEIIEFPSPKIGKHFTVIQGANGTGKTNLLNAITWCLYGKEVDIGDKSKGKPIINDITLSEMKSGDICNVSVRIHMRDEEGKIIRFTRNAKYEKTDDGIKSVPIPSSLKDGTRFTVHRQVNRDMVEERDPQDYTNRIIPEAIYNYFFFNGERLNDYFKTQSNELIKKEVFNISQLDLFEKVIDHLTERRDYISRELKKLNPEADKIKTLLDEGKRELKEKRDSLSKSQKKRNEAQELERSLEEKLRASSSEQVRSLQLERESLEKEIKVIEEEIDGLKKEQFNYLIETMPIILCYKALLNTKNMIEGKIDKGEIPPPYKKRFIQKLLEDGRCICNTDISQENEARQSVKRFLDQCDTIDEISEELILERDRLDNMLNKLKDFREKQIGYGRDIKKKEQIWEEKNKRLKTISKQIQDTDIEQIQRWEKELQTVREEKEKAIEEIGIAKADISRLEKDISLLEENYINQLRGMKKQDELQKTLLFCEETLKAAREIKNYIMRDIRKEIEKRLKTQYFELTWKKKNSENIEIDDEYNISVRDKQNRECIGTLSAGERQVLALSFMAALNIVSGFDVPIIIDTPLGRISREPKINIAERLPSYLPKKQVVLLVTEEEYTKEVRQRILPYVNKEYGIEFEETDKGCYAKVIPL